MISRPFQGHSQNCREIRPIDSASLLFIRRYVCSNICGSSLSETVDENSQNVDRNSLRFPKIRRSGSSSLSCVNFNRNAIHFYLIPIFNMYIYQGIYIFFVCLHLHQNVPMYATTSSLTYSRFISESNGQYITLIKFMKN